LRIFPKKFFRYFSNKKREENFQEKFPKISFCENFQREKKISEKNLGKSIVKGGKNYLSFSISPTIKNKT